jgi:hypothetical protein
MQTWTTLYYRQIAQAKALAIIVGTWTAVFGLLAWWGLR